MKVSDFVIKETVTNSGDKKYIIGKMVEQSMTLLQELGIRKKAVVFEPVNYELRTRGRYESFQPSSILRFDSLGEAELDLIERIKAIHNKSIKSERIIELD